MPAYRIDFSGTVQGVGFRVTCRRLAQSLPSLAGQVCNLPDGRVRLVVRGPDEDVNRLLEKVKEIFSGYIKDVQKQELPPDEDPLPTGLTGIEITHG
jgi:acylphosphatase